MDKNELKKQSRKVIELLEELLKENPDKPILKTLHDRYMNADLILSNDLDMKRIMIKGGCRAYLDAYKQLVKKLKSKKV